MYRLGRGALTLLAFSVLWLGVPSTGYGANIVLDFSTASNPNGDWSYGYTSTLGGAFVPYTNTGGFFAEWQAPGSFPMVARNTSGVTQAFYTAVVPVDVLLMHPGGSGAQSVVRWTASTAGTYAVEGLFVGLDRVGPTTSDVHVLLNSSTISPPFSALIESYDSPIAFSFSQSVGAGDTIDFAVGFGSNGSYYYDSTGLSGTITRESTPVVPEPASLGMMALGLGVAAFARRRSRRRNA